MEWEKITLHGSLLTFYLESEHGMDAASACIERLHGRSRAQSAEGTRGVAGGRGEAPPASR